MLFIRVVCALSAHNSLQNYNFFLIYANKKTKNVQKVNILS